MKPNGSLSRRWLVAAGVLVAIVALFVCLLFLPQPQRQEDPFVELPNVSASKKPNQTTSAAPPAQPLERAAISDAWAPTPEEFTAWRDDLVSAHRDRQENCSDNLAILCDNSGCISQSIGPGSMRERVPEVIGKVASSVLGIEELDRCGMAMKRDAKSIVVGGSDGCFALYPVPRMTAEEEESWDHKAFSQNRLNHTMELCRMTREYVGR